MNAIIIQITPLLLFLASGGKSQDTLDYPRDKVPVAASLAGPVHYQAAKAHASNRVSELFTQKNQIDTLADNRQRWILKKQHANQTH